MRSKSCKFAQTNMFPLKNKNGIVLLKSEHPNWLYEAYDWKGIFLSYLGKKTL